jgi:hypothetical protein
MLGRRLKRQKFRVPPQIGDEVADRVTQPQLSEPLDFEPRDRVRFEPRVDGGALG